MRYKVQVVGWTLIWSGVFIFGYIGWQLYVTDWLNSGVQAQAQEELTAELGQVESEIQTVDPNEFLPPEISPPPETPEVVELHTEDDPETGDAFALLSIDKLAIADLVVYEGVDRQTLKSGPGHMEGTPLPGQPGNSVVSGHRTTYGRPFFDFDLLRVGDTIDVESATGVHTYAVRDIEVVLPTDVWVTDPRPGGWLTLTTCNPKFSARERLVVWAEMVSGPNYEFSLLHKARFSQAS